MNRSKTPIVTMRKHVAPYSRIFMHAFLCAMLLFTVSASARVLVVNNNVANTLSPCKTAGYNSISAAITAAHAGDTIQVCPSTYPEAVHINKASLTLIGLTISGSSLIELLPTAGITVSDVNPSGDNPTQTAILLVDSVAGVTINDISVNGSNVPVVGGTGNVGIYYRDASGSIINSAVGYIGLNPDGSLTGAQEGLGIYVESGNGSSASLTVTGTSVHDYNKNGITAIGAGTKLVAKGNSVTGAGPTTVTAQNGIEVAEGAKGTVSGNVITGDDYTPVDTAATGVLFYQTAPYSIANSNSISETNTGIYFYSSDHATANGNTLSKIFNWDGIDAIYSDYSTLTYNSIMRAGLEDDNDGIYLCSSHTSVAHNNINEAPVGVLDDRSSADGCSGVTANSILLNGYFNVGDNVQILTNAGTSPLSVRNTVGRSQQHSRAKVSPVL